MAEGYAAARPPIHRRILERAKPHLPLGILEALDVGCGAGLSTQALEGLAVRRLGIDPSAGMIGRARRGAPECVFAVAAAEAIPLRAGSIGLMTAAGSLNYVDLDLFFPEAIRVLSELGMLLVYDFSAGRTFRDGSGLEEWFSLFERRYPPRAGEARPLAPDILRLIARGFRMAAEDRLDIGLPMEFRSYVDYMMTETNVTHAVSRGATRAEIRSWCEETLIPLWIGGEREIVFRAYYACLSPSR